jgi:ribosomal protein S18 acetylase RimI-like enzyme
MNNIIYRPARFEDIDTFYELYRMEHIESYGNFAMTREEVASEWEFSTFDLNQHTLYAFTETGQNIAFAELRYWRDIPVDPVLFAYVHPEYREQGIGTRLLEWGLKRAEIFIPLIPEHARFSLRAFANLEDGQQLLENNGFICMRQSHMMSIELSDDMPQAQFPDGFRIVTMKEHPVLEDFVHVYQETFRDHRGSIDEPLEAAVTRWKSIITNGNFPPENFMILKEGQEDAAVLIMANKSEDDPDKAFVQTLGTMPNYRRRGLATQMMYLAFQTGRKMGKPRIGLSVDASSLTGANKLYEKIGMRVDMVYNAYEREIRAGVELTKQTIT